MVRTLVDSLCGAADGKEFTKDQLKVLKWLLDAGCPVHNDHKDSPYDSPLHMVRLQSAWVRRFTCHCQISHPIPLKHFLQLRNVTWQQ